MAKIQPAGRIEQQIGIRPYVRKAPVEEVTTKPKVSQEQINKIVADINAGRITSVSQIPSGYRSYIDIPEGFFVKRASYQKQKSTYEAQQKEKREWEQAEKLVFKGKGYAAKGDPGVWSKVKLIHAGQAAAQKGAIMSGAIQKPTTQTFKLGAGATFYKPAEAGTVVVDGLGYSVKPELQEEFIKQMTKPTKKITPTPLPKPEKAVTAFPGIQMRTLESGIAKPSPKLPPPTTERSFADLMKEWSAISEGVKKTYLKYETKARETPFVKSIRESEKMKDIKKWVATTDQKQILPTPIERGKKDFLSPALVKSGYDWAATTTIKGGEFLGKGAEKILIKTGISKPSNWLFQPVPVKRETIKEIISSVYMFTSLAPFMRTGTAQIQESQYAGEVVEVIYKGQRVKMTLAEAKRLGLKTMTRTQATTAFSQLPKQRQHEILKTAFKAEFKNKVYLDAVTKQRDTIKAIDRAIEFMRNAGLKDKQIKAHILKLFPKLKQADTVLVAKSAGGVKPIEQTMTQQLQQTIQVPVMKHIGAVETGVKTMQEILQSSKTKQTTTQKSKTAQDFLQVSKTGQDVLQQTKTMQDTLQKSKTAQDFLQVSKTMQDTLQKSKTAQDFLQVSLAIPALSQVPQLKTKPASRMVSFFGRAVPEKPTKIKPFWLGLPSLKAPGVVKKKQGYIPQAKSKGKWVNLSKQPMTRDAALGRMSRTMDNTLSAQGRIRKAKGKVSTKTDAYFGSTAHKLRPYKIRKGVPIRMHNQFIEKKTGGFRLDTLGEQQGLRVAKFAKQKGWLAPTKKKVKRKPKKKPKKK